MVEVLAPALALVGAVGMTDAAREEWLTAACMTLSRVPRDLLMRGVEAAVRVADHPSKLVPAIMAEIADPMRWRRNYHADRGSHDAHQREPEKVDYCTPEEAAAILDEIGFKRSEPAKQPERGPMRNPTRADYIALGVPPETIDAIVAERSAA